MSGSAFWCPAPEPTGQELERIIFLTFFRNVFSAQHALSKKEMARLAQKRHRCSRERDDGDKHEPIAELEKDVENGALSNIISSLVRATGVSYSLPVKEETKAAVEAPAIAHVPVAGGSSVPPKADGGVQDLSHVQPKIDQRPRSALATLVESARLKEQMQRAGCSREKGGGTSLVTSTCRAPSVFESVALHRRHEENASQTDNSAEDFGVSFLPHFSTNEDEGKRDALGPSSSVVEKHPSQMSREEFLQQFKRAPRRGEIGYDAESVAAAEAVGYVMSGSRNREKQHYVDSIQRKLHEKEAQKLRLQFRKVEDERNDEAMVKALLAMVCPKGQHDNQ